MDFNILLTTATWIIVLMLFVFMLLFIFAGMKFGKSARKKEDESDSLLTAGIYTLMGLLLAFTFNMSGTRFDERKKIIINEANDIGTAILRTEMYPDSIKTLFKQDFKNYLEARITYSEAHSDVEMVRKSLEMSDMYGNKLFLRAAELSKKPEFLSASNQMIPALNSMIDIANSRLHGELYKVPDAIVLMLLSLLLIASFIYGYTSQISGKKVDWYLAVCFCLISVLIIYFMLDLDRPRRGIINLDATNQAIIDLRKMLQ